VKRPEQVEPAQPQADRTAGCQLMAAVLLVFWLCVVGAVRSCTGW
jgi:hypothetical protein